MEGKFPSRFVDEKTGRLKQVETRAEKIAGAVLVDGAHYGLMAAKLGFLALLSPVPAAVVGAAAGFYAATRAAMRWNWNREYDRKYLDNKNGDFFAFDLANQADQKKFLKHFGAKHPGFADDYLDLAAHMDLPQVPKLIIVRENRPRAKEWGLVDKLLQTMMKNFDMFGNFPLENTARGPLRFSLAETSSRPDGTDPVVVMRENVVTALSPGGLRSVTGHEFGHVKMNHTRERSGWAARRPLDMAMSLALAGLGVAGVLPLLPVAAFVFVAGNTRRLLRGIKDRHEEHLSDRAAILATGETGAFTFARKEIARIGSPLMHEAPPKPKPLWASLAPTVWTFISLTHPPSLQRWEDTDDFGYAYRGYTALRREHFASAAFAKTAGGAGAAPAQPAPKTPKNQGFLL